VVGAIQVTGFKGLPVDRHGAVIQILNGLLVQFQLIFSILIVIFLSGGVPCRGLPQGKAGRSCHRGPVIKDFFILSKLAGSRQLKAN
jgi:hypothetical protein